MTFNYFKITKLFSRTLGMIGLLFNLANVGLTAQTPLLEAHSSNHLGEWNRKFSMWASQLFESMGPREEAFKTYENEAMKLLNDQSKTRSFEDFANFFLGIEYLSKNLTSSNSSFPLTDMAKFRSVNEKILLRFLDSHIKPLLFESQVQQPTKILYDLTYFTLSPNSYLKLYDAFVRAGLTQGYFTSSLVGNKSDESDWTRAGIQESDLHNIADSLSLYHLQYYKALTSSKISVSPEAYTGIISRFNEKSRLQRLNLNHNGDLIKAFNLVYLLHGIKMMSRTPVEDWAGSQRLSEALEKFLITDLNDADRELKSLGSDLYKEYSYLAKSIYAESGRTLGALYGLIQLAPDLNAMKNKLESNYNEATVALDRQIELLPTEIKDNLNFLIEIEQKQLPKLGFSCSQALNL